MRNPIFPSLAAAVFLLSLLFPPPLRAQSGGGLKANLDLPFAADGQDCPLSRLDRYTDDFVLSASSAAGAVGDVVPVELSLTVGAFHGRLMDLHVIACYDHEVLEVVGEPVYSDVFEGFTWLDFFFHQGGETGAQSATGTRGFSLVALLRSEPATVALQEGLPVPVATVYFRVKGAPGDVGQIRFCDEEFAFPHVGSCLRSHLEFHGDPLPFGVLYAHSRLHVPGAVAVLPGEATRPEPPPMPPQAKVYPVPPTPETAQIRFELSGGAVQPGATGVPLDLTISSNFDFSMYSVAATFPARYLQLDRVEMNTSGLSDFDNDRGELWLVSGRSRRRIGAEGERVSVATFYFTVKEAAAEVNEVSVAFESFTVQRRTYFNWIGIWRQGGLEAQELPVMSQVEALTVTSALLRTQGQPTTLGDVNLDYEVNLIDAKNLLGMLFRGEDSVVCPEAADFNEDGSVNISDAVAILNRLFRGGPEAADREVLCK